ncbi:MAG: ABC transporter permease [Acidimicrobiales bacterium]
MLALSALALVVVFAFGLSWVFTTIGLLMRSPSAAMNAGFMAIFPLTFLSNVFVEPATLPGPLKAFVDVNRAQDPATQEGPSRSAGVSIRFRGARGSPELPA